MHGKISCVAKGARRPKSALLAGTQMFCFGEYLVFKGSRNIPYQFGRTNWSVLQFKNRFGQIKICCTY